MNSPQIEQETRAFVARTPGSRALQEQASRFLPGGSSRITSYFDPYPAFIDHGEGHYVYDVDGNRYLDFMMNATSLIMGHAHPLVLKALREQLAKGTGFSGPTEAQVRLAGILCGRVPSVDRIRFTCSGTEATMNAIRAARAFTGKHKIAKFEGGYHGSHEFVSVSVRTPADQLDPGGPTSIPEFPGQPPAVAEAVIVLPYNDLETGERVIRQHGDEIACVIMEPIFSAAGYVPAEPDFLTGIRELTSELGILLVFDEVQSFRVEAEGAQGLFSISPDLTAFGKTIGGGMPVGAFGGREEIMALFDDTGGTPSLRHGGTFNANPMTMVAGEATLGQLTPDVYRRLDYLGGTVRGKLRAVFDELDVTAQVTGIASFFGINFAPEKITDYRSMMRGDMLLKKALFLGLLNEGLLLQSGCAGALSTLTTEADVDTLVDAVRRVVQRIT